jgi:hypothetical protein
MLPIQPSDDDPLPDIFAEAREERVRYDAFLAALRESDPVFVEASPSCQTTCWSGRRRSTCSRAATRSGPLSAARCSTTARLARLFGNSTTRGDRGAAASVKSSCGRHTCGTPTATRPVSLRVRPVQLSALDHRRAPPRRARPRVLVPVTQRHRPSGAHGARGRVPQAEDEHRGSELEAPGASPLDGHARLRRRDDEWARRSFPVGPGLPSSAVCGHPARPARPALRAACAGP